MPNPNDTFNPVQLSVPTNYQPSMLDVAQKHGVEELMGAAFGPVGHSCAGTASIQESGMPLDDAARGQHIRDAAERGVSFNYIMDAPCTGNREYDLLEKEKILNHLKWISDQGATAVTVAAGFYVELIKYHLPHLSVIISHSAFVDTVEKARQFIDLGADGVMLHPDANRSFGVLRALGARPEWGIRLIVNHGCAFQCIHSEFHALKRGHCTCDSQRLVRDACVHDFRPAPAALLQMRWIRPEDVLTYSRMGVGHLVILGQHRTTDWIDQAIGLWRQGKSGENLLPYLDGGVRLSRDVAANLVLRTGRLKRFLSMFENVNCRLGCSGCEQCANAASRAVSMMSVAP